MSDKLWPMCPGCQMPLAGSLFGFGTGRVIGTCGFCDWAFDSQVADADLNGNEGGIPPVDPPRPVLDVLEEGRVAVKDVEWFSAEARRYRLAWNSARERAGWAIGRLRSQRSQG